MQNFCSIKALHKLRGDPLQTTLNPAAMGAAKNNMIFGPKAFGHPLKEK